MNFNIKIVPIVFIIVVGIAALMGITYYLGVTQNPYRHNDIPQYKFGKQYKNVDIGSVLKINIENYVATQGREKPIISTDTVTCHANLIGHENNYAYAKFSCTEVDANGKVVSADSEIPARFLYDPSYNILSYDEAADGEGYAASVKKLFPEKYYNLIITLPSINSEEPSTEVFTFQPGEIKSIKSDGNNKWILSVDLLSRNPNWIPGGSSDVRFFINQNTKIRNLIANRDTKMYSCNGNGRADTLANPVDFINAIIKSDYKTKYFDINGTNITAIYEQCLP